MYPYKFIQIHDVPKSSTCKALTYLPNDLETIAWSCDLFYVPHDLGTMAWSCDLFCISHDLGTMDCQKWAPITEIKSSKLNTYYNDYLKWMCKNKPLRFIPSFKWHNMHNHPNKTHWGDSKQRKTIWVLINRWLVLCIQCNELCIYHYNL